MDNVLRGNAVKAAQHLEKIGEIKPSKVEAVYYTTGTLDPVTKVMVAQGNDLLTVKSYESRQQGITEADELADYYGVGSATVPPLSWSK